MPNANTPYIAKRAAVLTNPITNDSVFLSADSASYAAFVSAYISGQASGTSGLDGAAFSIKASGKVNIVTSSTLILTLYYATAARTSLTYNATGVSSLGTVTSSSMTAPYTSNWFLSATFVWDVTSKLLNGYFLTLAGPTPTFTGSAVTTQITSADLSVTGPGFLIGAHLGTGNAASTVTLSNFSLEVL